MNKINLAKASKKILNDYFSTKDQKIKKSLISYGKKLANRIIKEHIDKKKYFYVIKSLVDPKDIFAKEKVSFFCNFFGKKLIQNADGKKEIIVTPDVKLISRHKYKQKDKIRYHQSNWGGSIHTDGPQLNLPPKILIMGCINNSDIGGDSLIVNAKKILEHVKSKKIFNILNKNFYFERRGFKFKNKNIFYKKIFETKNNKLLLFRYLREYIETAYRIKKIKINEDYINAFDYLDALLFKKEFTTKTKLNSGDVIIINNHLLAHGRTKFKIHTSKPRSLIRVWIN